MTTQYIYEIVKNHNIESDKYILKEKLQIQQRSFVHI